MDAEGRTIGEILRADICEPLGGVDAFIGLSAPEMQRVAPVENATIGFMTKQSLIPEVLGRKIDLNAIEMVRSFLLVSYRGDIVHLLPVSFAFLCAPFST